MDLLTAVQSRLPSQLESLLLPASVQPYVTRDHVQTALRVVVIVATYLLFRPHLESLFRVMTGRKDPRQEEIQARLAFLNRQKQEFEQGRSASGVGAGGGGQTVKLGQKIGAGQRVAMVGKDGKLVQLQPVESQTPPSSKGKGGGRKKKA
jgi:hypothetical protein